MPNHSPQADNQIFDAKLVESFRRRAARKAHTAAKQNRPRPDFLLARAAGDLNERIAATCRSFPRALDIYSHTDLAALALRASGKVEKIERIESLPEFKSEIFSTRIISPENLSLPPRQADLITSLLSLQNMNDIPGLLIRYQKALKPDGLFLACMSGTGTLGELRESFLQAESEIYGGVTPHIAPFPDVRAAGALLQRAGFALPVADTENITVRYDDLFALMADLRAMGMQNALSARRRRPFSCRFFARAAEIYADRFSDADGRIRATFSFIWLSGWSPAASQQKPARPGTAQISLAEVLGNKAK